MAFINGTITRYNCPICGLGCKAIYKSRLEKFVYYHAEGCLFLINGYPGTCDNSGKELSQDEISTTHNPNIVSSGPVIYEGF